MKTITIIKKRFIKSITLIENLNKFQKNLSTISRKELSTNFK